MYCQKGGKTHTSLTIASITPTTMVQNNNMIKCQVETTRSLFILYKITDEFNEEHFIFNCRMISLKCFAQLKENNSNMHFQELYIRNS